MNFINDNERLDRFTKYLLKRHWIVFRNPVADILPFVVSDHPVNFYNYNKQSNRIGDSGLAVDDTIINFPLNSQLIICLYAPTHWLNFTKYYDNCIIDLGRSENDFKYILNTNRLQFQNANRHIFYKVCNDEIVKSSFNEWHDLNN